MKIAICGKMASGKTTLADWFAEHHDFLKISLAAKVKGVAKDLFGMTHKDRRLLQQIGMKMREIKEDVWIDYLINLQVDEGENLIVDDVRFINEAEKLKTAGWTLIRINIDDDLQKQRLKDTYPKDWEVHWNSRTDSSEAQVDLIPAELLDLEITAVNKQWPIESLLNIIHGNPIDTDVVA